MSVHKQETKTWKSVKEGGGLPVRKKGGEKNDKMLEEHRSKPMKEKSVVSTIEGKDARLIIQETQSEHVVSSDPNKPRSIRPEPRDIASKKSVELTEAVSEEPEVPRLQSNSRPGQDRVKIEKPKFEKLEERPEEDEVKESEWGSCREIDGKYLLIGGGIVIILIIISVMLTFFYAGDTTAEEVDSKSIVKKVEEKVDEDACEQWFRSRSGNIAQVALPVLTGYMKAKTDKERSAWVRKPARFLKHVADWPIKIDPFIENENELNWDVHHIEKTAYLVLVAKDKDFMPVRIYFVRVGDKLKIDWEASTAWSEASFKDLLRAGKKLSATITKEQREAGVVESISLRPKTKIDQLIEDKNKWFILRSMIRKKDEFYAGPYNDKEYSSYFLLSSDIMKSVWGYVRLGSDLDQELRKILDYGRFVVSLKKDIRVTLKVKLGKKGAFPNQLEIVGLKHLEWVTPE